jgi:hypothetical protein
MTVALDAFPAFYDADGNPLSGGLLYTYAAGTNNPLATYTDRGGQTANPNPVVLDSAGRAPVWLTLNVPYKLILQDSAGVVQFTTDDFYGGADPLQLQAAGIVPATGGAYTGPIEFKGGATFSGTQDQDFATVDSLGLGSFRMQSLWINGDFRFNQRQVASVIDGNYGFDRTILICETGSVAISQLAQPTDGIAYAMRITQPDLTPKRVGHTQIVESRNCFEYRGRQVVFAPKFRSSVATTVRVALVAWTGTADSTPRDVVNNWASTTYTAGNFFVSSTLTIAVGAVTVAPNTWTDVPVSSASAGGVVAPSNMNNLFLVSWLDSSVAQNATLDSSIMRAGLGVNTPLWSPIDEQTELYRCLRYLEVFPIGSVDFIGNNALAGMNNTYTLKTVGVKRKNPTFASGFTFTNISSLNQEVLTPTNVTLNVVNTNAGQWRLTNNTLAVVDAEIG